MLSNFAIHSEKYCLNRELSTVIIFSPKNLAVILYFVGAMMESEEKSLQDPVITHRLFQMITNMSDDERRTLLDLLHKGLLKGRCRRAYFRRPLRLPVAYANKRHAYRNFIKDISLGGVFILTSVPFEVGEEIRIVLKTGDKNNLVRILGRIARVTPEGVGVRFISMNNDKRDAILSVTSEA
jgi:Tfp pilus assembly protein PilZ